MIDWLLSNGERALSGFRAAVLGDPAALHEAARAYRALAGTAESHLSELDSHVAAAQRDWAGEAATTFGESVKPLKLRVTGVTEPAYEQMALAVTSAAEALTRAQAEIGDLLSRYRYAATVYRAQAEKASTWELTKLAVRIDRENGYWAVEGYQVQRRLNAELTEVANRLNQTRATVESGGHVVTRDADSLARDQATAAGTIIHQALSGDPMASPERFQTAVAAISARVAAIRSAHPPSTSDLDWLQAALAPLTRADLAGLADYINADEHGIAPFGLGHRTPGFTADARASMLTTLGDAIILSDRNGRTPPAVAQILRDEAVLYHRSAFDEKHGISSYAVDDFSGGYQGLLPLLQAGTVDPSDELAKTLTERAREALTIVKGATNSSSYLDDAGGLATTMYEIGARNDTVATSILRDPSHLLVPVITAAPPTQETARMVTTLFDPVVHPPEGGSDQARATFLTFTSEITKPDDAGGPFSKILPIARDPHSGLSNVLSQSAAAYIDVFARQGENRTDPVEGTLKNGDYQRILGLASMNGGDDVLTRAAREYATVAIARAVDSGGSQQAVESAIFSSGDVLGSVAGGRFVAGSLEHELDTKAINDGIETDGKRETTLVKAVAGGVADAGKILIKGVKGLDPTGGVVIGLGKELFLGTMSTPHKEVAVPFVDLSSNDLPNSNASAGRAADKLLAGYADIHKRLTGQDGTPYAPTRINLSLTMENAYHYARDYDRSRDVAQARVNWR